MTWYNDPEPAGSPQPFASQLTGISTNQVATIGSGDLPTSLSNGCADGHGDRRSRCHPAAVEEQRRTQHERLRQKMCDEVIQPGVRAIEDLSDSDELEDLVEPG